MRKFLCLMCMMLMTISAMALTETKAYAPPGDDVGSVLTQLVCTPSTDGMPYGIVNVNIEDRHPLVTLQEVSTQDAQVANAEKVVKCDAMVSKAPVILRCPMTRPSSMICNDYTDPIREGYYSTLFRPSRADI